MGFMDKAKKLAEQAQQKLDEAQTQFNQSGSPQGGQPTGGPKFDDHGRPIPQGEPAAGAAPATPAPDPSAGFGGGPSAPASAEQPPAPTGETPPGEAPRAEERAAAPPPPTGGANATPDPFKPLDR